MGEKRREGDAGTRMPGERDLALDVLRAAATLYIVGFFHLYRCSAALSFCNTFLASVLSFCALGLFVFLSGYLLASRYRLESLRDVGRFYLRRVVRIYPLYALALAGFAWLGLIDGRTFVRSLFLANMFVGPKLLTLWFVTMIFVLYLVAPLYLVAYRGRRNLALTAALYAGLLVWTLRGRGVNMNLPLYLPAFAAGIAVARAERLRSWLGRPRTAAGGFLCFSALFFVYRGIRNPLANVLVADLVIFAVLPICWWAGRALARVLPRRPVLFLSYSSFCLYLFHRPVFHTGIAWYMPTTIGASVLYLWGALLPAAILLAYGVQRLYDLVLDRLARRAREM